VASGAGDLKGAFGGLLSANVFEVDGVVLSVTEEDVAIYFQGAMPLPVFTK
jgi:hypothetical protein